MTHLSETLPPASAEKLDHLAKLFVDSMAEALQEGDEAVFEYQPLDRVEPIEHESRDGFWSWNNGGYEVCLPASLAHAWGSGLAPAPVVPIIKSGTEMIADEWARQHPKRPPLVDCLCAEEGEPGHEWQEAAQKWEQEGWQSDDDCYYWKARAVFYAPSSPNNETGEEEVYLDAYLCSDSYGRDNIPWLSCYGSSPDQTAGKFKLTLPVTKFLRLEDRHVERLVKNALRKLPSFESCC